MFVARLLHEGRFQMRACQVVIQADEQVLEHLGHRRAGQRVTLREQIGARRAAARRGTSPVAGSAA
jgi:hypothetical protein